MRAPASASPIPPMAVIRNVPEVLTSGITASPTVHPARAVFTDPVEARRVRLPAAASTAAEKVMSPLSLVRFTSPPVVVIAASTVIPPVVPSAWRVTVPAAASIPVPLTATGPPAVIETAPAPTWVNPWMASPSSSSMSTDPLRLLATTRFATSIRSPVPWPMPVAACTFRVPSGAITAVPVSGPVTDPVWLVILTTLAPSTATLLRVTSPEASRTTAPLPASTAVPAFMERLPPSASRVRVPPFIVTSAARTMPPPAVTAASLPAAFCTSPVTVTSSVSRTATVPPA